MSATKTCIMYIQRGSRAGRGPKTNYVDDNGTEYWISGPRRDGQDTLYPGVVEIDDDVVEEYWRDIRGRPDVRATTFFSRGVHGNHATR